MSTETPNPQPDDTVRIVLDGTYVREGDPTDHDGGFAGHLVRVNGVLLCVPLFAGIEVLERADDPTIGEIRAVAPSADGTPKTAVKVGSRLSTNPGERCMWVIVETGEMLADGNVSGLGDVIGAVPDSPAAKVQSPARRSVRVPNEPHGPAAGVLQLVREELTQGHALAAVTLLKRATGWSLDEAREYVESMSEYQAHLSEHGRTEVDPTEARRMRDMGFDKQPEVQISDEDRALIASVLEERMGEYFRDTGYGYRLNTDHLAGVVADIVYAVRVQDRKRGDR